MVNLFPDFVQHDTPPGRKASYLYIFLLGAGLLAAVLYYSLATAPLIKTATKSDEFFGLEMYQGTTDCGNWYSCLYQKSQGANPSVSGLSCECSSQAGKLSAMTQYPLSPNVVGPSDWCAYTDLLEKYSQTLPSITSARASTQEDSRAFNFFSSQSACNAAHTASSPDERVEFTGTTQATVLGHIVSWQAAAATAVGVSSSLRFSPNSVPNASTAAKWLLRDSYLEVGVSANQAAKDKLNAEAGLTKAAASGTSVTLGTSAGDVCDDRMFWPLVVQINSRCREKRSEAEKFMRAMDSTYIISSTLLNRDSYTKYHQAQRLLHASSSYTTAALPPNTKPPQIDIFQQYAMLGDYDYLEHLDYLQLYYPLFSAGYALAYAEYTQKFVLQYYGEYHAGIGSNPCSGLLGTVNDVSKTECQLTFEETLKSVFPFADASTPSDFPRRSSKVDDGVATVLRSSIFHPTRTAGNVQVASNTAETLTFKHIFGRGTLLNESIPLVGNETATTFHDLTPLSRSTGTSPTTSSVMSLNAYTNGEYTISDPYNLKQKVKKCTSKPGSSPCGGLPPQQPCNYCEVAYTGWSVKVVSMEAKISSLKVIWKHSAFTQSDNKLRSEQMLRHLLSSLNATSTAKPQFDVGVSSLSLNSGTINLTFTEKKPLRERQTVVQQESGAIGSYSLPYLFQSIDTSPTINNGQINPNKLSICTAELVDALKYTDIGGTLGTHPNYPPFPLCRTTTTAATTPSGPVSMNTAPNPAQAAEGYMKPEQGQVSWAKWVTSDWTPSIAVPGTLVKTTSSGTMYGHRSAPMLKALELLPKVYPLWDRTQVAQENITVGYSYVTPNASILATADFALYWSICNPHLCQWVATDKRTSAEVITSIIAIMGGIAMACKTVAELWKKMLKKKSNVVPILHNPKVIVAGAQMTTDSVQKEE